MNNTRNMVMIILHLVNQFILIVSLQLWYKLYLNCTTALQDYRSPPRLPVDISGETKTALLKEMFDIDKKINNTTMILSIVFILEK